MPCNYAMQLHCGATQYRANEVTCKHGGAHTMEQIRWDVSRGSDGTFPNSAINGHLWAIGWSLAFFFSDKTGQQTKGQARF